MLEPGRMLAARPIRTAYRNGPDVIACHLLPGFAKLFLTLPRLILGGCAGYPGKTVPLRIASKQNP